MPSPSPNAQTKTAQVIGRLCMTPQNPRIAHLDRDIKIPCYEAWASTRVFWSNPAWFSGTLDICCLGWM